MSVSSGSRKTSSYHHGDIPAAAMKAGLELLEERGAAGLTLVALAGRIGVTPAALYRHFPDKTGLLAHLAAVGFRRFDAALRSSTAEDAATRLSDMSAAYLAFARDNPASYMLMFGARIDPGAHAETRDLSFRALTALAEALSAPEFGIPEDRRGARALQIWAQCHGAAALLVMGSPGIAFEDYAALMVQSVFRIMNLPDPPEIRARIKNAAGP